MNCKLIIFLSMIWSLVMCSQHHQISCPAVAVSVTRLGDVEPSSIQQKKKVVSFFFIYPAIRGKRGR